MLTGYPVTSPERLNLAKCRVGKLITTMLPAKINGLTGTELITKTGKVAGVRVNFDGELTAAQVRAELKASGVKGRELTKQVNDVISGSKDMRWAKFEVAVSSMRSGGYIPDYVDARSKSAVARFILPKDAGVSKLAKVETENEALKAANESMAARLAKLEEMLAMALTPTATTAPVATA